MSQRKKLKTCHESADKSPLFRAAATPQTTGLEQPQLLESYPDFLTDLLSPAMTSTEFLTRHFRRQAVHIPSLQGACRVAQILKRMPNPKQLFEETASDNVFVWLPSQNEASSSSSKINSIEVADPDMAYALYQAGHATYCRAPSSLEEFLLTALMENTGLGCGQYDASGQSRTSMGRAEVETFISTKVGSVTGWHTDFQENFTIVLSGRKKWFLQKGNVASVLRAVTPHYQTSAVEGQIKAGRLDQPNFAFDLPAIGKNAVGPIEEVILEPGDVLYFPAGMWHRIDVLEPGVSINCSLMATNYATLVCESLQHLLLRKPEWRASVCRPVDGSTTITDTMQALLQELPSIVETWVNEQGAAQGIIPPVLQQVDVDAVANNEDEKEGWVQMPEDEESVNSPQNEQDLSVDDKDIVETSSEANTNDIGKDKDDGQLVNLDDDPPQTPHFDPSEHALREKIKTHRMTINPLALLLNEKEVTRHYETNGHANTNNHFYILNVNYAGNEAHESHLRVRLQSDQPDLDTMSALRLVEVYLDRKPSIIAWLLYLGYLVWIPNNVS